MVEYSGQRADLMVALHAWRSAAAIQAFSRAYPQRPLIVVLTGTDAYRFIHSDTQTTLASLAAADRIVGLHGLIADCVPDSLRDKVRVIYQSARPLGGRRPPRRFFRVSVAGHLRDEKDSLRAALAVRDLPPSSRIRVDAYGKAHTAEWERAARAEAADNARYLWHGEIAHARLREVYRRSHLLALTSRMEGGANVISEAVMADLPVVASRIPGSLGLLGADYPGYYPAEDTRALRELLLRAESDAAFYADLQAACRTRRPLFSEDAEKAGWAELLAGL
jgi:putative glycosyltransferase (TIGR04348 family)